MAHATFRFPVFVCALLAIAAPVYAQQAADAAKAPAAAPSDAPAPAASPAPAAAAPAAAKTSAAATPDTPSADTLKKAREAGYHTKVRHGTVYFCKEEATLGTRFTEEHCMNEEQFDVTLERVQAQRDQIQNNRIGTPTMSK